MTIRNLGHLVRPQSIALIGASKRVSSVGSVPAKNLFGSRFDGPVMQVNANPASHTGGRAGVDAAYDTAFRRAPGHPTGRPVRCRADVGHGETA